MEQRIVIVGGGSSGWGPKLLADLLLTPSISNAVYVLHDIDGTNAERIARFARHLARTLGVSATITIENDPDRALTGADFVIITISTGGLDAMAYDLEIPEEYGVYHTVGDTVGPGGWARTLRNIPVFTALAQRINVVAPGAVILNYTNPMAQLTRALDLATTRPVIGLCHGLFENLGFLRALFGLENEQEIQCTYGGINHFFWITSLSIRGEDGLSKLREMSKNRSLPALLAEVMPGREDYYVADELFKFTGILPYLADRHTCEFFSSYITSGQKMTTYRLKRTTIHQRRDAMRRAESEIEAMTDGEIPDRYRTRSRETAADVINAIVTGRDFIDVGNVPNVGQVTNLPLGAVVETPVLVTRTGFRPITVGSLPEPARTWIERHVRVQDLTVEAARDGDLTKAFTALVLDPAVAHLSLEQITDLGRRLLKANEQYLPQFKGKLD